MDTGTLIGHASVIRSTAKALLVLIEGEEEEAWIPKSVIHDDSEVYSEKSSGGNLIVQTWWAKSNGFA